MKQHRKSSKTSASSRAKSSVKKSYAKRRQDMPAHKRFLLHPVSVMVVLVTGVFMVGLTYKVIAATVISSVIEAPMLQSGAVIAGPADGSNFTNSTVTVLGTCPNSSYVKLYVNSTFGGAAWCSANSTWQINTSLYAGKNTLIAQDFNTTNEKGPVTSSVSLNYAPPAQATVPVISSPGAVATPNAPTTSLPTTPSGKTFAPLLLTSDFHYQTFSTGHEFSWTVNLQGGTPPYNLHINWGDKTSSTLTIPTDPTFSIHHSYKRAGYFPVVMHTVDAKDNTTTVQLAALIKPAGAAGVIDFNSLSNAPASKASSGISSFVTKAKSWLWLAWPSYIIVVLMLISFWLGEKKEYQVLFMRRSSHKRAAHTYKSR